MTNRAFTPPRFVVRHTVDGLWSRYRVWDTIRGAYAVGCPHKTKRAAEKRADKLNARVIKQKAKPGAKTRIDKLRSLNYAGDPAPIRQYRD